MARGPRIIAQNGEGDSSGMKLTLEDAIQVSELKRKPN